MGVLPPESFNWTTEDDFKLKNAVEAGASLESLAKGAVKFSRRFTLQELQERWHALLYDPVVSAEASAQIMEFECSNSALLLKSNQFDNTEIKLISGKRKVESVRHRFYAMRKRIHNQGLESMDFSFPHAVNNANNVIGNGEGPPPIECILGQPVQNHFDHEDSNIDVMNSTFPNCELSGNPVSNLDDIGHEFCTEPQNCIVDSLSMDHRNIGDIVSHGYQENISLVGNGYAVEELGNIFENTEGAELSVIPDQTHVSEYSELGGNQAIHLPVLDSGLTFDNVAYSSQLPEMPAWNSNADTKSAYDVVFQSDGAKVGTHMSCNDMKNTSSSTDSYLAQLSNSLFDFTNEEELLCMDIEENLMEKTYIEGLTSLLLDPPGKYAMPNMEFEAVSDDQLSNVNAAGFVELSGKVSHHGDNEDRNHNIEAQLPSSAPAIDPVFNRAIICTLNTEDPEIPSNDDVFLLPLSTSASSLPYVMQCENFESPPPRSSPRRFSLTSKKTDHEIPNQILKEQSHLDSPMIVRCLVNMDLSRDDNRQEAVGSIPYEERIFTSEDLRKHCLRPVAVKEVKTEQPDYPSNIPSLENHASGSNRLISCHHKNASGDNPDVHPPAIIQLQEALCTRLGPKEMITPDPIVRYPPSNEEHLSSDSDKDIPNFSDVEAMILDVDLSPDDQDFYSSRPGSIYEDEDAMRSIIRLEQAADAFMQRAMTIHGAFAILHGRSLKYYMKKPEVVLGRVTEDVIVDIDLGREGRNSRVSRRQAIIQMSKDGSFQIKNLGKYPIFVNSSEVASKHSASLSSGCLIEIRGMLFVFETNKQRVKQYVDSINNGS